MESEDTEVTVRQTSREAYDELVSNGKESSQRARILHYLLNRSRPVTRLQISEDTKIRINAVAGRVNAMVEDGIITEREAIPCPISGRTVMGVEATVPTPKGIEQLELV